MSKILIAVLLLLALAACGKTEVWNEPEDPASAAQAGQPPAGKAAQRAILNMVVAGSIDAKGIPVGEAYTFAPDQPQITVIARVGKVADGSSIRFAWYQETDDEDEPLFEQTVSVSSFDRVYSEGKNPGMLAAGMYKVTATLGDYVREIEFTVAPPPVKSAPRAALGDDFNWLSAFGVKLANAQSPTSEADPGQPPVPGTSGAVHAPSSTSGTTSLSPSPLQCGVEFFTFDYLTPDRHDLRLRRTVFGEEHRGLAGTMLAQFQCPWPLASVPQRDDRVFITHNGAEVPGEPGGILEDPAYPGIAFGYLYYVEPCRTEEGGWDLPGEKVKILYSSRTMKDVVLAEFSAVYTLHEDDSPPKLEVHSTPAKHTKVKAGDKIEIKFTAQDDNPLVWETGLQKMWLTDPAGDVGKPAINPSPVPQACAKKARKHTHTVTYTVPSNPPDVIKLCAHAQDYAGNKREKCTTFPTVDCRHATFHYDVRVTGYRRVVETWKEVHPGTVTTTADWTGDWSNVGVSVEQCALSVKVLMPAVQAPDLHPATGEIHLKYDFDDALPASDPNPVLDVYNGAPPCRYHNDVRFPASMYADADAYLGSRGGMHFDFQAKPGPNAAPFAGGTCPAGGPAGRSRAVVGVRGGESSADDGLKSIRGWNWGISDGILNINNQRAPVSPLPFPFAALLAGKGFSLDSGVQSAAVMGTNGPGSAQVTDRLIVSFSPAVKR